MRLFAILLVTAFGSYCFSQAANSSLKIDSGKSLRIEYKSAPWNKNPNSVDTAWLLFRDAGSGSLARIEMQETSENSGIFTGSFRIGFQANADVLPEIYLVPRKMMESADPIKKIAPLIKDGTLLRKPFFLRQASGDLQIIAVFDTREQAVRAYQEYKSTSKPIVDRSALEAQARQKMALETQKSEAAVKAQENERQRIEAEEKRKRDELLKRQAEMNEAEKARRKAEAKSLAEQAMALYKAEKYPEAEAKFQKAIELDPSNDAAYFPYGVSLYKNQKYNQSLVALNLAKGSEANPTERDFFVALNHMKLKEQDAAIKEFNSVKEKNDKVLSPSAAFYVGVLEFQRENYDVAKPAFEYTLDNSSDPRMDQQAEAYIEQIANIKMFQLLKSKKFILGFNWGLMYDSNILSQAAANAQTSLNGIRAAYGGSVEYRPIYSENYEFSVALNVNDMYSWDTSFQPKQEFQNTDPLVVNLSFPYRYKGKALEKPYILTLTPAIETIYMNVSSEKSGVGVREQIVSSSILKADNMFVMTDDYFASYAIEVRNDYSLIDTADDDSQTANKITMSTSQTHFKNKKKTEASTYDGSLAYNMAKGKNQRFARADAGASYTMPWKSDTTVNGRFGIFYSPYSDSTDSRIDNGLILTGDLRKPLNEAWAGVLNASFMKNNSNIESDAYDKYSIMAGVTYSGLF